MNHQLISSFVTWEQLRAWFDVYAMASTTRTETVATPESRLERTRRLLQKLGDPQEKIKVIHVAGTTGKGSTCLYIESILRAHGFKTGLTISPHAIDLRERFQINGEFVSEERLIKLVTDTVQDLGLLSETAERPGYFELLMLLAYRLFAEEQVEYAVIETGVGGRFDPSNAVRRSDKYCVITKIGLDHQAVLGESIKDIAAQKMGIVQLGMTVIIGAQELISLGKLETLAREEGAIETYCLEKDNEVGLQVQATVPYLQENAQLAVFVAENLARRDGWNIDSDLVTEALAQTVLPLRFEQIEWKGKTIILDAAHNAQKMKGLAEALRTLYPNERFAIALAFGEKTRSAKGMLKEIQPLASELALVDFVVGAGEYRFRFMDPVEIKQLLNKEELGPLVKMVRELMEVFSWMESTSAEVIVVTGSFHFVSMVRARLLGMKEPW